MLLHALLHREEEFHGFDPTTTEEQVCEVLKSLKTSLLAEFSEGASLNLLPAQGRRADLKCLFHLLASHVVNDAILSVGQCQDVCSDAVPIPEDPALELLLAVLQVVVEVLFQLCIATFAGSRQRFTH